MAKQLYPVPLKTAKDRLKKMQAALLQKDIADATAGRPINQERKEYVQALQTAVAMITDYLYTGAPATHHHKGVQGLLLDVPATSPAPSRSTSVHD